MIDRLVDITTICWLADQRNYKGETSLKSPLYGFFSKETMGGIILAI